VHSVADIIFVLANSLFIIVSLFCISSKVIISLSQSLPVNMCLEKEVLRNVLTLLKKIIFSLHFTFTLLIRIFKYIRLELRC
jgi:hypothetical protein